MCLFHNLFQTYDKYAPYNMYPTIMIGIFYVCEVPFATNISTFFRMSVVRFLTHTNISQWYPLIYRIPFPVKRVVERDHWIGRWCV